MLDLRLFAVSAAIIAADGRVALACLVGTFFLLIHDASPFHVIYEFTIPHVDSAREPGRAFRGALPCTSFETIDYG